MTFPAPVPSDPLSEWAPDPEGMRYAAQLIRSGIRAGAFPEEIREAVRQHFPSYKGTRTPREWGRVMETHRRDLRLRAAGIVGKIGRKRLASGEDSPRGSGR